MMTLKRKLRFNMIRILRQKQGSHQISLGFILGFFPCWFPTFGIGPFLSISLAKFVHGSIPSAIIAASLGSFLWPVLFYLNYQVGNIMNELLSGSDLYVYHIPKFMKMNTHMLSTVTYFNKWGQIGFDFLLGFLINSVLFSLFGYIIIKKLVTRYRLVMLSCLTRKK
jgi:uncharacterized protein (DUF2062 family)